MILVIGALAAAGCSGGPTPATNVTRVAATLNAKAQCSQGPCWWYFRYGTDGLYQHQTPVHESASGTGGRLVAVPGENVTNLVPGTTYEYQLCGRGNGISQYECVGPDGSRSTSEQFTTQVSKADCVYSANSVSTLVSFGKKVGYHFRCAMTFANSNGQWGLWETPWITTPGLTTSEDANWQDWKNCANPADPCAADEKRQLIITTELWPSSEENNDPLTRCAQGKFNSHATALGNHLVSDGLGDSIIRMQPEGNDTTGGPEHLPADGVNGFPTAQEEREWATCWSNEALAMKSVPGAHFIMDWTVNAFNRPIPLVDWYPGDRAVDIIGIDAYDRDLPASTTSEPTAWNWIFGRPDGISTVQQFAAQHGKPMSFGEWGLTRPGSPEYGLGDDPTYVDGIAASVRRLPVTYQAYFLNGDPGALLDAQAPKSLAQYVAHFGGSGDTTGKPTIVP